MDLRVMGWDPQLLRTLHQLMDTSDEAVEKSFSAPSRTYVRDAKAMASTPMDVKELPNSYVFVIDMPGLKSSDIKVQVEDDNVLIISGERKREENKEQDIKYLRMERRIGKFMRKFVLPENANTDSISAVCQDGVLTVTVNKVPPPEPKKPKTIETDRSTIKIARPASIPTTMATVFPTSSALVESVYTYIKSKCSGIIPPSSWVQGRQKTKAATNTYYLFLLINTQIPNS